MKISPTIDPFQAIGVEKNVNHIFLQIGEGKGAGKSLDFNPVQPHLAHASFPSPLSPGSLGVSRTAGVSRTTTVIVRQRR